VTPGKPTGTGCTEIWAINHAAPLSLFTASRGLLLLQCASSSAAARGLPDRVGAPVEAQKLDLNRRSRVDGDAGLGWRAEHQCPRVCCLIDTLDLSGGDWRLDE
jgi:hypothetical protein